MSTHQDPSEVILIGEAVLPEDVSLLDFWQWAFADICDDDLKGYFAEWLVRTLLHLPQPRRVSWADSDLITPAGVRIEVKASAYWQSWKLVNEDGSRKPVPKPVDPEKIRISFGGLQSGTSVAEAPKFDAARFKSDIYVFCLHTQTDPSDWDAWLLSHWEFYALTRDALRSAGVGKTISLSRLRSLCAPMVASEFQKHMKGLLENHGRA